MYICTLEGLKVTRDSGVESSCRTGHFSTCSSRYILCTVSAQLLRTAIAVIAFARTLRHDSAAPAMSLLKQIDGRKGPFGRPSSCYMVDLDGSSTRSRGQSRLRVCLLCSFPLVGDFPSASGHSSAGGVPACNISSDPAVCGDLAESSVQRNRLC